MEQLSAKKLKAECSQKYKGPLNVLEVHRPSFQVVTADTGTGCKRGMKECHRRNSDVSRFPPMLSAALQASASCPRGNFVISFNRSLISSAL